MVLDMHSSFKNLVIPDLIRDPLQTEPDLGMDSGLRRNDVASLKNLVITGLDPVIQPVLISPTAALDYPVKPGNDESGCHYSGRPALHPSGQRSCSKLLQAILSEVRSDAAIYVASRDCHALRARNDNNRRHTRAGGYPL